VTPSLRATGGAERQTIALMLGLHERGHRVMLLTLAEEAHLNGSFEGKAIAVGCADMHSRFDFAGWYRAARIARALDPDLVVSWSVSAQVVGQLLASRQGCPHVTVEHAGAGIGLRAHQRTLLRRVASLVDGVVAVSETQVPLLLALGFDASDIRVIPNGIAPDEVQPKRAPSATRADLGLDDGAFVALLAANLRPEKHAVRFVRAVARAAQIEPRVRGIVAGAGAELGAVVAEVQRSHGTVQALGRRDDVPALLAAADVVCLSSAFEAMPVVLVEAMAAGKPIIATRVGGVVDLVSDGLSGVLVPPADEGAFAAAVVDLARDPGRARALGRAAHKVFLERFTLDRMVEAYEELFVDVLAGRESR
jgi:glycosyltransferase involved in cell wall biosynthesis